MAVHWYERLGYAKEWSITSSRRFPRSSPSFATVLRGCSYRNTAVMLARTRLSTCACRTLTPSPGSLGPTSSTSRGAAKYISPTPTAIVSAWGGCAHSCRSGSAESAGRQPCQNVAMLDHVSIQCADAAASAAFYDAVLTTLGGRRIMDFGAVIGYGIPPMPDFWIGPQTTGQGFRESHLAFTAVDRAR